MGFLKLLFNAGNAEGIREAMRMSYRKHRSQAHDHQTSLYGSLASRNTVAGRPADELHVWGELSPFLVIEDAEVSLESLAEYAVLRERPFEAKLERLRFVLNAALRSAAPFSADIETFLSLGYRDRLPWTELLDSDVVDAINQAVARVESRSAERAMRAAETGESASARRLIAAVASKRARLQFQFDSSTGRTVETVTPLEIRQGAGEECLVALNEETRTPKQYPLRLISDIHELR